MLSRTMKSCCLFGSVESVDLEMDDENEEPGPAPVYEYKRVPAVRPTRIKLLKPSA